MIQLFFGAERYLLRKKKQELLKVEYPETNLLVKDTFDSDCEDFADTFSLFGGEKVLILELPELTADENLLRFLSTEHSCNIYIFAGSVDTRTKIYKKLSANALELGKPSQASVYECLTGYCSGRGKVLDKESFSALISRSAYYTNDNVCLDTLYIYMEQMCLDNREITPELVSEFVPEQAEQKIWGLFSTLAGKRLDDFIKLYDRLIEQKENAIGILSVLMRTIRIAFKVKLAQNEGIKDIIKELGVSSYTLKECPDCSLEQLASIMELIQDTINDIKHGASADLSVNVLAIKAMKLL